MNENESLQILHNQIVYLNIKGVMAKLSISRSTFARWRKEGRMPEPCMVNGSERWRSTDIDKMIEQQNPVIADLDPESKAILDRVRSNG